MALQLKVLGRMGGGIDRRAVGGGASLKHRKETRHTIGANIFVNPALIEDATNVPYSLFNKP